ncbi:unnamed protein product, partial [Ceratitis capitata]
VNRLVSTGVVKPINSSNWAALIVTARKPNNKIRLCADLKVNINQQIDIDRHPITNMEELLFKLKR